MAKLNIPVTQGDHINGGAHADVTLVEYGDYQCPYCGLAYPIIKRIQEHFGKRLRFVFRHFPLTKIHPLAEGAAEVAEFAGAHGKFWDAHDLLYEGQRELGILLYDAIAESIGLPQRELHETLAKHAYASKLKSDFLGGVRCGVTGTPAFYIDGRRHNTPYDYQNLRFAIEAQLHEAQRSLEVRRVRRSTSPLT